MIDGTEIFPRTTSRTETTFLFIVKFSNEIKLNLQFITLAISYQFMI